MSRMTTGTENVVLFTKYNVLFIVVFAIVCTICGCAAGLGSILEGLNILDHTQFLDHIKSSPISQSIKSKLRNL